MLSQFKNLSCYEEFEIQCALIGISKIDILKEIGYQINDYYFFISKDGIFNWYDLEGNHVEDPGILKELNYEHILRSITKCIIPDNVTNISDNAFSHCESLKEITIPNSVINIGNSAFAYCESLKEITIPDSVISIGDYAFFCCDSLTTINISNNNLTDIGYYAFWSCESLKEVIFKGKTLDEVKQMENYPFGIEDESIIKCEM